MNKALHQTHTVDEDMRKHRELVVTKMVNIQAKHDCQTAPLILLEIA